MKKSHGGKTILVFLVFSGLFFSSSAFAWWSEPDNTHYLLTLRSYKQLERVGLLYHEELRGGSDSPDKIEGFAKAMQHHRHYHRISINFSASINAYRNGDYHQAAWTLASAFHYLQDAIDLSSELNEDDKEGVRQACYALLQNWKEVMSYPDIFRLYWDTYSNELRAIRNLSLKDIVRRFQSMKGAFGNEMKREISAINRNPDPSEEDFKKVTKVLLRCIATMQAGQDLIIEMFVQ